jgi:hypothetical protein
MIAPGLMFLGFPQLIDDLLGVTPNVQAAP